MKKCGQRPLFFMVLYRGSNLRQTNDAGSTDSRCESEPRSAATRARRVSGAAANTPARGTMKKCGQRPLFFMVLYRGSNLRQTNDAGSTDSRCESEPRSAATRARRVSGAAANTPARGTMKKCGQRSLFFMVLYRGSNLRQTDDAGSTDSRCESEPRSAAAQPRTGSLVATSRQASSLCAICCFTCARHRNRAARYLSQAAKFVLNYETNTGCRNERA